MYHDTTKQSILLKIRMKNWEKTSYMSYKRQMRRRQQLHSGSVQQEVKNLVFTDDAGLPDFMEQAI